MSRVIAQVTLGRDSGLPADVIVNTLHFEDDSGFGTDAGLEVNGPGLVSRLQTFYQAIGPKLSNTLSGTGTVDLYNWDDPKPRIPRRTSTFTFTTGTSSLPGEVALCLSYRAALASGQNAARRRGRIFLGPFTLSIAANMTTGQGDFRPADTWINDVLVAARTMAAGGDGAYRLAVFSPTALATGSSPDDAWNDVTDLWIDNAWDTIRSRGARASSRQTTTIASTVTPVTVAAA